MFMALIKRVNLGFIKGSRFQAKERYLIVKECCVIYKPKALYFTLCLSFFHFPIFFIKFNLNYFINILLQTSIVALSQSVVFLFFFLQQFLFSKQLSSKHLFTSFSTNSQLSLCLRTNNLQHTVKTNLKFNQQGILFYSFFLYIIAKVFFLFFIFLKIFIKNYYFAFV